MLRVENRDMVARSGAGLVRRPYVLTRSSIIMRTTCPTRARLPAGLRHGRTHAHPPDSMWTVTRLPPRVGSDQTVPADLIGWLIPTALYGHLA